MKRTLMAAVDCGTTAIKAAVVDRSGRFAGLATRPCPVRKLDGHVENDAPAVVAAAESCLREALRQSNADPAEVVGLAVATQRATVVACDGRGRALGPAISWQDMCGTRQIERLRQQVPDRRYGQITGLPNNPVFTLGKLLWLKEQRPALFRRAERFALLHDFVMRQLGCDDFYCDWSNASLTGMFDIRSRQWSDTVLAAGGVPRAKLSQLVAPGQLIGRLSAAAARRTGLLTGTPLVAGGGDQQCAGIGAGAVHPGVVEITVGTAAVPLSSVARVTVDPRMRVTCGVHAAPGLWEVEGLQNTAGAALGWAASVIGVGPTFSPAFLRAAARVAPGANGVLFCPHLAGASAPRWNPLASGMFLGLRAGHTRSDLVRAVMEGVSLETRGILECFASLGVKAREVRLTGGCTSIAVWNQIQADIFGKAVSTLATPHATTLGAAILAACGTGVFASVPEAVRSMVQIRGTYLPSPGAAEAYDRLYARYGRVREGLEKGRVFGAVADW